MNILEYIDDLMAQGMTEEEAGMMADIAFNLPYEPEYDC